MKSSNKLFRLNVGDIMYLADSFDSAIRSPLILKEYKVEFKLEKHTMDGTGLLDKSA